MKRSRGSVLSHPAMVCVLAALPLLGGCGGGGGYGGGPGGGGGGSSPLFAVVVSATGVLRGSTIPQSVAASLDTDPARPGIQASLQVSGLPAGALCTLSRTVPKGLPSSQDQTVATTRTSGQGLAIFSGVTFETGQLLRVRTADDSVDFNLSVTVTGESAPLPPNHPPAVQTLAERTVASGATVTLTATATDPDAGDTLSYSWTRLEGPTVALQGAATAACSFAPVPGLYRFLVTVSDSRSGVATAETSVLAAQLDAGALADLASAGSNSIAFHSASGSKTAASCQYCHGAVVMSKSLSPAVEAVHYRHTFSPSGPALECTDCHQSVDLLEKSGAHVRRQVSMSLCYGCHGSRFFAARP